MTEDKWSDRDYVLEAVKVDGLALEHASQELRNDSAVVIAAVRQNLLACRFSDPSVRRDPGLQQLVKGTVARLQDHDLLPPVVEMEIRTIELMESSAWSSFVIPTGHLYYEDQVLEDFGTESEWVKAKVELMDLLSELGRDKEWSLIDYRGDSDWDSDEEFCRLQEMRNDAAEDGLYFPEDAGSFLDGDSPVQSTKLQERILANAQGVGEHKWTDREFVLKAVKSNGRALEFASEELRNDREIVKATVKNTAQIDKTHEFSVDLLESYSALRCAISGSDLQHDKGFILELIELDGMTLSCASDELRADREVVLPAVTQFGQSIQFASEELQNDQGLIDIAEMQKGKKWAGSVEIDSDGLPMRLILYDD